ncbi:XRE family transcriptional regulator [Flavobacterium sp. '19STA2R22 D10 B1']|uniref:XRE family transcriptional regulator n=1 Tax=Flavobacterium aerium TaxID=3037261 RepID=UPI00278C81FC|nr:XRE family transcriptional regulator [Flavobacterium sp. '19STA2R22 D10 B1']
MEENTLRRIKKYIDYKGISVMFFEKEVGMSNGSFASQLKKGKTIGVDKLENILNKYAEINPTWLLTGIGDMITPTTHNYIPKSNASIIDNSNEIEIFTNSNGNVFYEYPDGTIKIEVLKIPFPAYASYLEAYNDEEKLDREFLKTQFSVDRIGRGNYLAFDAKGDSMNGGGLYDTPDGAELLAREIGKDLWQDGFRKTNYGFVLLTKKAIYHKDIQDYNINTGMLTLRSRNPIEKDFEISINDIYRIFNVIKRSF